MNKNNKYLVIIPAYNPSRQLEKLVEDLNKLNIEFLIINDGSTIGLEKFQNIKEKYNCTVLEYVVNKGKGYALKYGINFAHHYLMIDMFCYLVND